MMKNRLEERAIQFTEEEAMGLLELSMTCPMELTLEQRAALVKLSDFCRQFMRSETSSARREDVVIPPAFAA